VVRDTGAGPARNGFLGQSVAVEIRLLGRGDERVAEQASRLFGAAGDLDTTAFLSRPETRLLVAEDDGGIAGWAYGHELVHPDGERTMLLYSLDVAERARGRGYGRSLVTSFVEHARSSGCTEVWVLTDDSNAAGVATYRSAGGHRDPVGQVMFAWHLAEGRHSLTS
jgi:ribosomal protein S18 acetylase RimI-like enzyme